VKLTHSTEIFTKWLLQTKLKPQRIVVNGSFSEWLPVQSDVPQGSVLGPLLFLLYIGEIHHIVSNSTVKLFADDIALYKQIVSPSDEILLKKT